MNLDDYWKTLPSYSDVSKWNPEQKAIWGILAEMDNL
jgi:hypothetical protein